jgi:hypothetical protein
MGNGCVVKESAGTCSGSGLYARGWSCRKFNAGEKGVGKGVGWNAVERVGNGCRLCNAKGAATEDALGAWKIEDSEATADNGRCIGGVGVGEADARSDVSITHLLRPFGAGLFIAKTSPKRGRMLSLVTRFV